MFVSFRSFKSLAMPAATAAGITFVLLATLGRPAAGRAQDAPTAPEELGALKDAGEAIYSRDCASCHGAEGTSDGAGPALAGNNNLSNKEHVLKRILGGSPEKGMEAFGKTLSDRDIAAVATFVRNAWDNTYGVIVEADVKPLRAQIAKTR